MKKSIHSLTAKINKQFMCLLFTLLMSIAGFAQNVSINTTGLPPNPSAGLDVDFSDKGVLIPRVSLTSTSSFAPLSAHVAGMIVYNTATGADVMPGFYYDNGTKWIKGFLTGSAVGDMLYWNGSDWSMIPIGQSGQYLQLSGANIPFWGGTTSSALSTTAASAITGISATSGGIITSDGGSAVLSRGVCWSTTPNPTIANTKTIDGVGLGTFSSSLTGLSPVTTYFVRSYAMNSTTISYGNEINFTTQPVLPTLAATIAASAITGTSATSGGNITSNGGAPITERGICYGTTANPTTANTKVIDPTPGNGIYTCNISGLTGYTTYYVRAYAINSVGTAYGTQISFQTLRIPPTLYTVAASNIMSTTATSGGSMNWNGAGYSNYQAYGVAYSTTPNAASPTKIATSSTNYSVNPAVPINPWVTNLTGLLSNTTYYIRSYLDVYAAGWITVYGNELSFTTALIQTSPVITVTNTTAVCGGTIGAGANITARGVCYSTVSGPTISDNITSDGTGTGTFVSNLSGLTDLTTYYIRAYCTDNLGVTVYGNEYNFTTGTPKTIGQTLAGGKVIWVDASGQHGIIGGLTDLGSGIAWGCSGVSVGTTIAQGGGAKFAGLNNTNLMIAANCNAPSGPAQLCAAYTAGGINLPGFTNWYLPSHDELQLLVDQRTLINLTTTPSYAGSGVLYWSSTEYSTSIAYTHYSLSAYDYNCSKYLGYYSSTSNLIYIRPVRAF